MLRRFPFAVTISCLTLAVFFAGLYSITVGPMNITISDSIQSLLFRSEQLTNAIHLVIHDIRLARHAPLFVGWGDSRAMRHRYAG
ncbi:hypothetical protein, partial [Klebsiella pneumoniae]|uniref:hypothetical protein n=1 Tax=Klebsiella pneumoniae TaxID=573 RepID=UPI001D0DFC76